jgi:hypothetical protein
MNQQPLEDQWYYKDSSFGAMLGPLSMEMMMQWTLAGYFPPHTPISNGETGIFVPLSTVHFTAGCRYNNITSSYDATMDSRQLYEGVEARLPAANPETFDLSTQHHYSSKEEHNDDDDDDDVAHCPYPIVIDTNNPDVESEDVQYPTDLYYPTWDDDDDPTSYGQKPFENDLPA